MISNENIVILNVENSKIIQQYAIREIKKILDKYKKIDVEEIRSLEKLISSISNEELKEEFLNDLKSNLDEDTLDEIEEENNIVTA